MRSSRSLSLIVAVAAVLVSPAITRAATITVAEFKWEVVLSDPQCVVPDPDCTTSLFVLTNLWDGPAPVPDLTNNELTLDGAPPALTWPDLTAGLGDNAQIPVAGIPTTADASVSFLFGGVSNTLSASLVASDLQIVGGGSTDPYSEAFALIQFRTIPEPATSVLLLTALVCAVRRRLAATRQHRQRLD